MFEGTAYSSESSRVSDATIYKNNPFHIEYNPITGWKGMTGYKWNKSGTQRFCEFSDLYYGIRAYLRVMKNGYFGKGLNTIESIVRKYSPDGNESNYIRALSQRLGLAPNVPLSWGQVSYLGSAMSAVEGYPLSVGIIEYVKENEGL